MQSFYSVLSCFTMGFSLAKKMLGFAKQVSGYNTEILRQICQPKNVSNFSTLLEIKEGIMFKELKRAKKFRDNPGLLSMSSQNKIRLFSGTLILGIVMIIFGAFLSIKDAKTLASDNVAKEEKAEEVVNISAEDQTVLDNVGSLVAVLDEYQTGNQKYPVSLDAKAITDLKDEIPGLLNYDASKLASNDKVFMYQSDAEGNFYAIYAKVSGKVPNQGNLSSGFNMPKGYNYFFSNK